MTNTGANGNTNKQSRKQIAYEFIKEQILSCVYEPGAFLNEQQICDELHFSRTPIRDALSRLEQEGLVNIMPKKGMQVAELKLNSINYIYEVRTLIEPFILRRYGHTLDRDRLENFCHRFEDEECNIKDYTHKYDLDDELHDYFVSFSDNPYLIDTYNTIKNLNRRLRILSGERIENRVLETSREHLAIVVSCLQEDYEAAAEAMIRHLEASRIAAFQCLINNNESLEF